MDNISLYDSEIDYLKSISKSNKIKKNNNINTNKLSYYISPIGGHYSKMSSLYYNDFDKSTKKN